MAEITDTNPQGAGRPEVNLDEALQKLQPFLSVGYSLWKACQLANLNYTTYLYYYQNNADFCSKVEGERSKVNITARKNIINAIEKGGVNTSFEWLDRLEKDDFSKRTEIASPDGKPLSLLGDTQALITLLQTFEVVRNKINVGKTEDTGK